MRGTARFVLVTLLIAAVVVTGGFAALGWWSSHGAARAPGLVDGRLAPCGPAPNCVSSEPGTPATHTVAPLSLPELADTDPWALLRGSVEALGGDIVDVDGGYLHATFTSRIFRFVDDLELRRDGDTLHLRSASRVGYSDLGANRARVEALRRSVSGRLAR